MTDGGAASADGAGGERMGAVPGVRWGLGDVAIAWVAGLVVAVVVGSLVAGARGTTGDADAIDLVASLVAQGAGVVGAAALVCRAKGRGSLRLDLGLVVRARDWPWLVGGGALQVVSVAALAPVFDLLGRDEAQESVRVLRDAPTAQVVLAAVAVTVVGPLAEEILFRGLLLRSLARRTSTAAAVWWSAAVFAVVHLIDPGAAAVLAPLLAVGLVCGVAAVRSGELSQPILFHAGFNLVTAVVLLA